MSTNPNQPLIRRDLLTFSELSRRTGIGTKRLRALAREGAFPVYAGAGWRRVLWADFVAWVKSTRVPPSSHAHRRVAEVLEREQTQKADR